MSEALDRLNHLINEFDKRVQATPGGAWANQSPCADWKARDVVEHVANNYFRLAAGGAEGHRTVNPAENIATVWSDARVGFQRAMAKADLSQVIPTPMGEMPMEQFLGRIISTDTLVHTWDLARAVGGDEKLHEDAVKGAYEGLKPMDAMIRNPGFFDAKIEAPAGADLQTEFLNFLGRKV
jgi:uncharacterized protein (TIGR03086 family)